VDSKSGRRGNENALLVSEPEQEEPIATSAVSEIQKPQETTEELIQKRMGTVWANGQTDSPDTPLRFSEKKRLHWAGKTCRLHKLAIVDRS
jgi:tRNA-dihydrouridine synthase 3